MNTTELEFLLSKVKINAIFNGVFACDRLPINIKLPFACIVNLSPAKHTGTHWVSLYIDNNGYGEYFDSYGFKPRSRHIQLFLRLHCRKMFCNTTQLQPISSNKCGKYAVLYIIYKLHKGSINNFIKLFSKNTFVNDITIDTLYNYFNDKK